MGVNHPYLLTMASEEGDILADLECGVTTSEEERSRESISSGSRGKKALSRSLGGALSYNGSISSDSDPDSSDSFSKSSKGAGRRVELFIDGCSGGEERWDLVALLDKKNISNQCKKPNLKKASKPPRPPKGPSLNASDLKLVRELTELAARKRARTERVKALRKMKEAKRQSSSSSLIALIITIFFFLVILFQGIVSQNKVSGEFQGSPAPAMATKGFISVQLFDNAPANKLNGPVSLSLNYPEMYRLSPGEEEGRDIGWKFGRSGV